jgi:hypothetical protein
MTDDLVRYLQENRDRYTREALTAHLVAQGHDPAAVEAAWARMDWAAVEHRPATGGGLAAAIILGLIVILAYGIAIFLSIAVIGASPDYGPDSGVLIVYTIAMLAAGLYTLYRMFRAPSTGRGAAGVAAAFAISAAVYIGLSGLCIVGLSATASY